ncbi:hypothetical protein LTR62_006571 [Meristemomyces frigidus]|uniref:Uncharacterized protein n=1 Tax=Meristemomyces frigidus TaxID=1508187 RepID=A0AAN7YEB9_9PEZI|nr:hypothetical protein LTR62_006571 [Meristemomyces frigidus]
MATMLFPPAVPFGFDNGLIDENDCFSPAWNMMPEDLETWVSVDPANFPDQQGDHSSYAASDWNQSPGPQSGQLRSLAGTSSSLSPGNKSIILTPTSSALHEISDPAEGDEPGSDGNTPSPGSSFGPLLDDYDNGTGNAGLRHARSNMSYPPRQHPAIPSRVAQSTAHRPHAHVTAASASQHWASPILATDSWAMDPNGAWGQLDPSAYPPELGPNARTTSPSFDDGLLTNAPPFAQPAHNFIHGAAFGSFGNAGELPAQYPYTHAGMYTTSMQTVSQTHVAPNTMSQQYGHMLQPYPYQLVGGHLVHPQQHTHANFMSHVPSNQLQHPTQDDVRNALAPNKKSSARSSMSSTPAFIPGPAPPAQNLQIPGTVQRQPPHIAAPHRNPTLALAPSPSHVAQKGALPTLAIAATRNRQLQPLASESDRATAGSSRSDRGTKGGRRKNEKLRDEVRQKSSHMRKAVACWRCAFQRDSCPDDGSPCGRCIQAAAAGTIIHFPCSRAKLPTFIHEFLPPSMTSMHEKQPIQDYMKDKIRSMDVTNGMDIWLTCGHGPALRWRLYEFEPVDSEPCWQWQYRQINGQQIATHKYAPPFAMAKFDDSDDKRIDEHLNEMITSRYLEDFGWTCFEEETPISDFQARLLQAMCTLYTTCADPDLAEVLKKILRMTAITYIMGHTLTICEDTAYGVLSAVRDHHKPSRADWPTHHVSPRLANRQLKFYFSICRQKIFQDLLNWQQQTLHASKNKDEQWLPAFCVTLALALVLEEGQRLIWIQADAKVRKDESSDRAAAAAAATTEAVNACQRIDDRFGLLADLFRAKYRSKRWKVGQVGSFGPSTPLVQGWAQQEFLNTVYGLLIENEQHLRLRRDVDLSSENQTLYTSRLVAKFLLPFLEAPGS